YSGGHHAPIVSLPVDLGGARLPDVVAAGRAGPEGVLADQPHVAITSVDGDAVVVAPAVDSLAVQEHVAALPALEVRGVLKIVQRVGAQPAGVADPDEVGRGRAVEYHGGVGRGVRVDRRVVEVLAERPVGAGLGYRHPADAELVPAQAGAGRGI